MCVRGSWSVRRDRSSWRLPFVRSAAPIAAFVATKGGGRTGPAPPSVATAAEAKRRMAGAGYFASRCKAPLWGATENSRLPPLRGRTACRRVALSRRPRRGPLRQQERLRIDGAPSGWRSSLIPCAGPDARTQEPDHVFRGELDTQRCTQRVDASVSQILVEISTRGDSTIASIPFDAPCRTGLPPHNRRPDRCHGRHRAGAALQETGWLRGARPKVLPPSAW